MADRPILFSAPMVRAVLREIEKPGTCKTQTRRVAKQPPPECGINYMLGNESWLSAEKRSPIRRTFEAWGGELFRSRPEGYLCGVFVIVPRYQIGDRLWVRESLERANGGEAVGYPADLTWLPNTPWEWKRDRLPSIHMPRRLSRITLSVNDIRVQRLQDISEDDAKAEGVEYREGMWGTWNEDGTLRCGGSPDPREAFRCLWININGTGSWEANPWVVAITFRPILANIDRVEALAA